MSRRMQAFVCEKYIVLISAVGWGGGRPKKLLRREPKQLSAVLMFRDAVKHSV